MKNTNEKEKINWTVVIAFSLLCAGGPMFLIALDAHHIMKYGCSYPLNQAGYNDSSNTTGGLMVSKSTCNTDREDE